MNVCPFYQASGRFDICAAAPTVAEQANCIVIPAAAETDLMMLLITGPLHWTWVRFNRYRYQAPVINRWDSAVFLFPAIRRHKSTLHNACVELSLPSPTVK